MGKIIPLRGLIYSKYERESHFADAIGWSRQRLNKITNGTKEPDLREVQTMAEGLGVPFMEVANIFLRKESPNGDKNKEE